MKECCLHKNSQTEHVFHIIYIYITTTIYIPATEAYPETHFCFAKPINLINFAVKKGSINPHINRQNTLSGSIYKGFELP